MGHWFFTSSTSLHLLLLLGTSLIPSIPASLCSRRFFRLFRIISHVFHVCHFLNNSLLLSLLQVLLHHQSCFISWVLFICCCFTHFVSLRPSFLDMFLCLGNRRPFFTLYLSLLVDFIFSSCIVSWFFQRKQHERQSASRCCEDCLHDDPSCLCREVLRIKFWHLVCCVAWNSINVRVEVLS